MFARKFALNFNLDEKTKIPPVTSSCYRAKLWRNYFQNGSVIDWFTILFIKRNQRFQNFNVWTFYHFSNFINVTLSHFDRVHFYTVRQLSNISKSITCDVVAFTDTLIYNSEHFSSYPAELILLERITTNFTEALKSHKFKRSLKFDTRTNEFRYVRPSLCKSTVNK